MCWAAEDLSSNRRIDYLIWSFVDTIEYLIAADPNKRLSLQYPPREAKLRTPTHYKKLIYIGRTAQSPTVLAAIITFSGTLVSLLQK